MKRNTTIKKNKGRAKKGGYVGNEMWEAHRLEGVVENRGIKNIKKHKKNKIKTPPLDKEHNPNKRHKDLLVEPIE